jgi:hypothetical protein
MEGDTGRSLETIFELAQTLACQDLSFPQENTETKYGMGAGLIIGDSHSAFYMHPEFIASLGMFPLHAFCSGGSARGLSNSSSKSGYGNSILSYLDSDRFQKNSSIKFIMFKFGQVDIEFVHNFSRIKHQSKHFDLQESGEFITQTVSLYFAFLRKVKTLVGDTIPIVVCSVFPPALLNDHIITGYSNGHIAFLEEQAEADLLKQQLAILEYGNLHQRTTLHRLFNTICVKECQALNLLVLNDFDIFINKRSGLIDRQYTPESKGRDHHIDFHVSAVQPARRSLLGSLADMIPGMIARRRLVSSNHPSF